MSRRKPIVLLDVDGPLTMGFFSAACAELCKEGVPATTKALTRWDFFAALNVPIDVEERVRKRLRRPGVAAAFPPNFGAKKFLKDLRQWADVYAVTSPLDGSPTWAYDREQWLAEYLGFDGRHVISARDKRLVAGDAFVDDKLEHLVEWRAAWPKGLPIMWTEPHNEADEWSGPRARDYAGLVDWLGSLQPRPVKP
jgi:5'(3')-deoxyribonucleotidase